MKAVQLTWAIRILAGLLAVLLLAVAGTALLATDGADRLRSAVTPGGSSSELAERHREVAEAAEELTLAFLRVDHRDMDPLMDAVLDGATGEFKQQYADKRETLVEEAARNESVSTGEVVALGVGDLDEDSAQVFVAANSMVSNKSTDGTEQPRYYRLQLDLVREGDRWLTTNVQFVG